MKNSKLLMYFPWNASLPILDMTKLWLYFKSASPQVIKEASYSKDPEVISLQFTGFSILAFMRIPFMLGAVWHPRFLWAGYAIFLI